MWSVKLTQQRSVVSFNDLILYIDYKNIVCSAEITCLLNSIFAILEVFILWLFQVLDN